MSTATLDTQIRAYLDAIRERLDDLRERERSDLLEDLEQHLREVAAEEDGSLVERLGPPEAYADDLRASVGLPSRGTRSFTQQVADRLAGSSPGRLAAALWASQSARAVRAFLPELRPGWWVLRGYLAVTALTILSWEEDLRSNIPIPRAFGSPAAGLVTVAVAVVLSVFLGRRATTEPRARKLSLLATVAVAAASLVALPQAGGTVTFYEASYGGGGSGYLQHGDGTAIANICPYASDGSALDGVLLFDQRGRPIIDTAAELYGLPLERKAPAIANAYPKRVRVIDPETGAEKSIECPASLSRKDPKEAEPGATGRPTPTAGE